MYGLFWHIIYCETLTLIAWILNGDGERTHCPASSSCPFLASWWSLLPPLPSSPEAAITKHYTLGGLEQSKFILWQFWRRVQSQAGPGLVLLESLEEDQFHALPLAAVGSWKSCCSLTCGNIIPVCSLSSPGLLRSGLPTKHLPPSVGVFSSNISILPIYGLEFSLMPPS